MTELRDMTDRELAGEVVRVYGEWLKWIRQNDGRSMLDEELAYMKNLIYKITSRATLLNYRSMYQEKIDQLLLDKLSEGQQND